MRLDREETAVVITGPERAELLSEPSPQAPLGPREVTGRTLVTLISPGTELAAAYTGDHFPSHPGYAAVFEIDAVGSEVGVLQIGDRALCMGPHRSFQRVEEENAIRLPPGLAPETAVFARMVGVSMSTLTTTTARPPETTLVTGLGLVGHLAAQVFHRCGYSVIACDPDPARRDLASRHGILCFADVPVEDPKVAGRVALALECSGHEAAVMDACRVVRKRGEVVLIGVPWRRRTSVSAHELLHVVFHRYVVMRSGWEWEISLGPEEFRSGSIRGNMAGALRWLEERSIVTDDLVETVAPHDCQVAYQALLHGHAARLGYRFDWR